MQYNESGIILSKGFVLEIYKSYEIPLTIVMIIDKERNDYKWFSIDEIVHEVNLKGKVIKSKNKRFIDKLNKLINQE